MQRLLALSTVTLLTVFTVTNARAQEGEATAPTEEQPATEAPADKSEPTEAAPADEPAAPESTPAATPAPAATAETPTPTAVEPAAEAPAPAATNEEAPPAESAPTPAVTPAPAAAGAPGAPAAVAPVAADKLDEEALPEPAAEKPAAPAATADGEEDGDAASGGSAVLSAGGVVLSGKGFPLGVSFDLGASVGTGWLLPGYKRQPFFNPWLNVSPNFQVPKYFDWQPTMAFSGSLTVQIPNVFDAYQRAPLAGPFPNNPTLSDTSLALLFPGLLTDKWATGISITPLFRVTAPLSMFSRQMNRLAGFSGLIQGSWASASAPFMQWYPKWLGVFGVQYRLGFSNWFFRGNSPEYNCGELNTPNPFDTINNLAQTSGDATDYPIGIPRDEEKLGNGRCRTSGRQFVGSVSNSGAIFYSIDDPLGGNHVIRAALGIQNILLRPLSDRPDLRSPNAISQSYFNGDGFSSGSVTYGYQVPGDWIFDQNLQVVLGMSSFQPLTDQQGRFYFPWFDFSFGNQYTGFTLDLIFTI